VGDTDTGPGAIVHFAEGVGFAGTAGGFAGADVAMVITPTGSALVIGGGRRTGRFGLGQAIGVERSTGGTFGDALLNGWVVKFAILSTLFRFWRSNRALSTISIPLLTGRTPFLIGVVVAITVRELTKLIFI